MSMKLTKTVVSAEKRLTPNGLFELMKQVEEMTRQDTAASLSGVQFVLSPEPEVKLQGARDDTFERLEVKLTREHAQRILESWQEHLAAFSLDLKELLEVPMPDGLDEVLVRCDCENGPSNRIVRTGYFEY